MITKHIFLCTYESEGNPLRIIKCFRKNAKNPEGYLYVRLGRKRRLHRGDERQTTEGDGIDL